MYSLQQQAQFLLNKNFAVEKLLLIQGNGNFPEHKILPLKPPKSPSFLVRMEEKKSALLSPLELTAFWSSPPSPPPAPPDKR